MLSDVEEGDWRSRRCLSSSAVPLELELDAAKSPKSDRGSGESRSEFDEKKHVHCFNLLLCMNSARGVETDLVELRT